MALILPLPVRMIICISISLAFLSACKKSAPDPEPPPPGPERPKSLNLEIQYRVGNKSRVRWVEPRYEEGPIRYQISLDSKVVDSFHIFGTFYDFVNLKGDRTYNGKIVTRLPRGDTMVENFTIPTYEGLAFPIYYNPNSPTQRIISCFDLFEGLKWTYNNQLYLQYPMLEVDKLYLFSSPYLVCLDANTGAELYRKQPAGFPIYEPAWNDTKVIFPTERRTIMCINKADGTKVWESAMMSPYEFMIGTIYENLYYYRGKDGPLTAYDINTGALIWKYDLANPVRYVMPAVANNVLVVATDRQVFALNATSGVLSWSQPITQGTTGRAVTIKDSIVYVPAETSISAFNLFTGKLIWKNEDVGYDLRNPAVDDKCVYVFSKTNPAGTESVRFSVLNKATGQFEIAKNIELTEGWRSDPIVAERILYYARKDGNGFDYIPINVFSAQNASLNIPTGIGPIPFRINGHVYIEASSGMKQ